MVGESLHDVESSRLQGGQGKESDLHQRQAHDGKLDMTRGRRTFSGAILSSKFEMWKGRVTARVFDDAAILSALSDRHPLSQLSRPRS